MKIRLMILILLSFCACKPQDTKVKTVNRDFYLPVIVQLPTKDTIEFINAEFLNESRFIFHGKYQLKDTLYVDEHNIQYKSYERDFLWEYAMPKKNDTLTTDGFQIFADYKTTVYKKFLRKGYFYFPVYVVNETSRTKVFIGKDSHAFGLQEAIDSTKFDRWLPIEYKGAEFCGNGYFGLKVYPGEFIMLLAPKYAGDEKNLMRIRLNIGGSLYLSQSFMGTFNHKQFDIKRDTWAYRMLEENETLAIQLLFYGTTPKGYD